MAAEVRTAVGFELQEQRRRPATQKLAVLSSRTVSEYKRDFP